MAAVVVAAAATAITTLPPLPLYLSTSIPFLQHTRTDKAAGEPEQNCLCSIQPPSFPLHLLLPLLQLLSPGVNRQP